MGKKLKGNGRKVNTNNIDLVGKKVSIGVDVHKNSWRITAITEGVIIMSTTLSQPNYVGFEKLLSNFEKASTIQVAYEAGPTGFDLYDKLTENGIKCIVVPPSLIPVESGNKVKTDKKDSKKLAILLDKGLLKDVWVLSPEERAHRQLVRTRRQIANHRSDVMRQIKSFLLFHSIEVPFTSDQHWTVTYVNWLHELDPGDSYLKGSLKTLVELYDYLTVEKKRLTKEVNELACIEKYKEKVNILKSIPGVGILSAMEILVELQDVSRFRTADELAAYLGLTPSQYSSGDRVRMGHITHTGNDRVRTTLIESCWLLIGKDLHMREKYHKIKARRGGKRSIVALARNLSGRLRRMLLDGENYKLNYKGAS